MTEQGREATIPVCGVHMQSYCWCNMIAIVSPMGRWHYILLYKSQFILDPSSLSFRSWGAHQACPCYTLSKAGGTQCMAAFCRFRHLIALIHTLFVYTTVYWAIGCWSERFFAAEFLFLSSVRHKPLEAFRTIDTEEVTSFIAVTWVSFWNVSNGFLICFMITRVVSSLCLFPAPWIPTALF